MSVKDLSAEASKAYAQIDEAVKEVGLYTALTLIADVIRDQAKASKDVGRMKRADIIARRVELARDRP